MSYRIMIVEDDYWTATDLAWALEDRAAVVAGPFGSISEAFESLRGQERPDAAILEIRLRSTDTFPVADMLMRGGIPFVFTSGSAKDPLPTRFAHVPRMEKPFLGSACVDVALALAEARTDLLPTAVFRQDIRRSEPLSR